MTLKPSSLRVGFALLVGATLAIGMLSLRLLRHEETRLADEARRTLQGRAQLVADDLQLAVRDVQEEVLNRLAALPPGDLSRALAGWPEANPLVRNTFIWNQAARRLEQPSPTAPTTAEEKRFILRYSHLFAARLDTLLRAGEREDAALLAQASPRMQLNRVAQQVKALPSAQPVRRGWIPWFEGDQLFLLGWVEQHGRVAGVELETAALLSRLLQVFPREAGTDRAWALLDGAGNLLHQTGGLDIGKGRTPAVAASLSPSLPHWQVAFFGTGVPAAAAGGYRLITTLLVGALLLSILAGGTLLLLEAGRKAREARQKTSFVANVSHELKTPLTTLRMYAELLREGRVRAPEQRQHYLDVMVTECARLTRLVNNMLDFGRLEQQRRTYAVEPLDLAAWLPTFLEAQRLRIEEAGLRLAVKLPGAPLSVRIDRDALEQAVLNLLDNALKYAADGKQIEIVLTATTGSGAQLEVNDRGPGVPEELREKIFEKFYRLDQSLTARVPGSGLGLSIARRLLRDLGGDLVCLPREGGGACFRIHLKGAL